MPGVQPGAASCKAKPYTNYSCWFAVGPAPAELESLPHDAAQGDSAARLPIAVCHHVLVRSCPLQDKIDSSLEPFVTACCYHM